MDAPSRQTKDRRLLAWVLRTVRRECVAGPMPARVAEDLGRRAGSPGFEVALDRAVRAHHGHSRLLIAAAAEESTQRRRGLRIRSGRRINLRKPPTLRWDASAKIAHMTFFTYVMDPVEPWDARPEWVERCRSALDRWLLVRGGCRGIIIDLRRHHGGSYRPFMHAVGRHLLRGAVLQEWVAPNEDDSTAEVYDGERQVSSAPLSSYAPAPVPVPVAVLIGPGTASSGEIAASMLAGRPGVRTFGRETAGALSVNQGYRYRADPRIELLLTVRRVRTVDGRLQVSERLRPDRASVDPERDARSWLSRLASPNAKPTSSRTVQNAET